MWAAPLHDVIDFSKQTLLDVTEQIPLCNHVTGDFLDVEVKFQSTRWTYELCYNREHLVPLGVLCQPLAWLKFR